LRADLQDLESKTHRGEALRSFSISAKEERSFSGIVEKLRANLSKVEIEGGGSLAGQRNDAVSLTFGVPYEKPSLLEVDVADVEPDALAAADSGPIQNLENRAVSFLSPGARGWGFHQAGGLAFGQDSP
jgi:hypothetical protein